jgi:hypothetical protein
MAVRGVAWRTVLGCGLHLHIHVEAHLLFQIAVDLPALPEERKPPPEFA